MKMPKIPHSPIRMYFLLQPPGSNGNNQAESECKACGLRMKGNHASNMERHVRRSHPEIYEKYLEFKQKSVHTGNTEHDFVGGRTLEGLDVKFDPANFIKIKKIKQAAYGKQFSSSVSTAAVINQQQTQQSVLDACVELVTTNGRPFSLMNDSGMQALINLTLPQASTTININEKIVKELVAERASKLKSSIIEKVRNDVVNVKVDITTVCNRSFIGISFYVYDDGETFSRMISFNEINVRHDSGELESLIWKELHQFEIVQERVYCIVIDSGSNLSTLTNDSLIGETDSSTEINDVANIPTLNVVDSIENVSCTTHMKIRDSVSISDDTETNVRVITVFAENEDEENDLDWCTTEMIVGKWNFESSLDDADNYSPVMGMKCVADALQIAVYDALRSYDEISDLVKGARLLYHKLLALSDRKIINVNLQSSISPIRWKSIFAMLEKVIAIKNSCIKLGMVGENEPFWNQIEDLLSALKPCKTATDILQKEKLTISDVYKVWFNCILETSKLDFPYAKILADCMRQKQAELFNEKTFLAALFLDPRFNNMILTDVQKKTAIDHLVACHRKFTPNQNADKESEELESNEEIDELERIFQLRESSKTEGNVRKDKSDKLEIVLKNFCESEPRLKTTENVVSFWEKKKAQYPDIYNLARIIFSVPATQQSFVKLVSQVQYAMNTDVAQISENLFNDVILLRSNSEFGDERNILHIC